MCQRRDLPFPAIVWAFAIFILGCGTTHVMEVVTLWFPVYWVSGSIKALTALVSIGTAVLLVSVIPEALALRSPAELEAVNESLKNEISERRRAEEEVLKGRELLVRQERMRVVGQLASGIAHDLNNTLNVIKLRVAAMAKDHSLQTLHATAFHAIERAIEDAVRTVDKVQELGRLRREKQPAFLQTVISQAVELARTSIEERSALRGVPIQIEMELPPNLAPVDGSASDLRQIFLNLLLNAGDAMDQGGKIKIAANSIEHEMVLVTVSDEGTGIRAQDLPHIFEPFYTTKGPRGTGLGLSIASSVMESMYGSISAANRPEGGAIFTLAIPLRQPHCRQSRTKYGSRFGASDVDSFWLMTTKTTSLPFRNCCVRTDIKPRLRRAGARPSIDYVPLPTTRFYVTWECPEWMAGRLRDRHEISPPA